MKIRKAVAVLGSILLAMGFFNPLENQFVQAAIQKETEGGTEAGTEMEAEPETEEAVETEPEKETAAETESKSEEVTEAETEEETKPEEETEAENESETEEVTEAETEEESKPEEETEAETESETEEVTETETEEETEVATEGESEEVTEPETEEETEAVTESESEEVTETESEEETEVATESESEEVTETEPEEETEAVTESESEEITEPETEPEEETEAVTEGETEAATSSQTTGEAGSYWDPSWYLPEDFRFYQVEKKVALVEGGKELPVYEKPDSEAKCVGILPYFGIAYILEEVDGTWDYIESGDVRGFVERQYLAHDTKHTEEVLEAIGEEAFETGRMLCEKADNEAFTFTHTTVYEVVAPKQYALTVNAGAIYEYRNLASRVIGEVKSGTLVYVLETADGWVYVESGDVRGFLLESALVEGTAAKGIVDTVGETKLPLAEGRIQPEENRSCYFTLASVKSAAEYTGEEIARYANEFVGKLPYVWGGTSLQLGADCSGFIQSVYAAFGISIPRLAQDQGSSGQAVEDMSQAKPGDVVYYGSGPHVGIYIGDGKVVQCAGNSSNTASNPGTGPTISPVDYMPITAIRRYAIPVKNSHGMGTYRRDPTTYTREEMELIWAIVAQEDNGSYEGALAVISSAMNRTESAKWGYCGSNALEQLTAPGQYCYSNDTYWQPRLNGNVPDYVKQAVSDCLDKGIRNHQYTSFRSRRGSTTGPDAVQVGGNWFFDV